MDSAKSQLIDRLKTANSVLITVSSDPSVDQLAACIGLTLLINKMGKHGSAVFSGKIPSTIEFLKPEETLEKTADSLRDFIIALDRNKADKLRYKVEDQLVKIFITPYKTSLSEDDFEFSQGDFNIELVIALGVQKQEDLDQAIVAHGRILHDATVACINLSQTTNLGTINWQEPRASSLCEIVTDLASSIGENLLDEQISTALLTGIIAETNRFSNEKTSPQTMSVSAKLMSAGANQQLVATNLSDQPSVSEPSEKASDDSSNKLDDDGALTIDHEKDDESMTTLPAPTDLPIESNPNDGQPNPEEAKEDQPTSELSGTTKVVTEPPTLGGTLTANSTPEAYDPLTDPAADIALEPPKEPTASVDISPSEPVSGTSVTENLQSPAFTPPPANWTPPPSPPVAVEDTPNEPQSSSNGLSLSNLPPTDTEKGQTLDDIERAVNSPHLNNTDVDGAREQVESVLAQSPDNSPGRDQAINAVPLGGPLHNAPEPESAEDNLSMPPEIKPVVANTTGNTGLDPSLFSEPPSTNDQVPPVPPPLPNLLNSNDAPTPNP